MPLRVVPARFVAYKRWILLCVCGDRTENEYLHVSNLYNCRCCINSLEIFDMYEFDNVYIKCLLGFRSNISLCVFTG